MSTQPDEPSRDADTAPPGPSDIAATFCATLVDEWVHMGLSDAVVSPGSRSTPMALALANDERVRLHLHHDERSASFMALGRSLASGRPTVMLTTSGTAATELHPAVVEAFQAHVPLLVLTADRPPELQNVGAPQTIDQRNLFGRAVRWYCEPGVPSQFDRPKWRELASEAWTRSSGPVAGPVHINLAFREPLLGVAGELPERSAQEPAATGSTEGPLSEPEVAELAEAFASRNGVIVAGVRSGRTVADAHAVHLLADHLGWPVIADGPSGCRLEVIGSITAFNGILQHSGFVDENPPDVILRIGGLLTSKVLNQWIAESEATKFLLDPDGGFADPDKAFKNRYAAPVADTCNRLRGTMARGGDETWRSLWVEAERAAVTAIDATLSRHPEASEPALVLDVFTLLSEDGTVVLSSSMPVRDAECFAPTRSGLRVLSNRGANGIDGVASTAVGASLGGDPTALLIGDVAFLHDTNALLGLKQRQVNLLMVVIDNRGGGIFSFLPVRDALDEATFERLFGTPHDVDLVELASAHGVPAERVSTRAGAQAAIAGALTRGGPRVVVVETERGANRALHDEIAQAIVSALDRLLA